MVQVSTGGKSQLASAVSVFLLLTVILFVGPMFRHLPKVCDIHYIIGDKLKFNYAENSY